MTRTKIAVDVKIDGKLDSLYFIPRNPEQGAELLKRAKKLLPDGNLLRRTADGIRFSAMNALTIIDNSPDLDLHLSDDILRFLENRKKASQVYPAILSEVAKIKKEGPEYALSLVEDSQGLDVLDLHQIVNVAAMTIPSGYGLCVFDEQGAGKTVTFIFALDLLVARDYADAALIVAPKSMVSEWPQDFARFRGGLFKVKMVTGSRKQKREILNSGADVLVTNFETAVSMEAQLKSLFRSAGRRYVLAIDESFFIKSIDAKRTRSLRRLREWCERAFVLCGTPAPNSPQDLVQQFSIVDFGLTFDGMKMPKNREEAITVVQSRIEERGLFTRHVKKDVLPNLPKKKFHRIYTPMAPNQQHIYESALHALVLDLENVTNALFKRQMTSFSARRAALLQICSNPAAVSEEYSEIPAKLTILDGLLAKLVEQKKEKVVIWSFYTKSITAICERYARYGVLRYDGQVKDVEARREAVRRFQEDGDARLFVANPAAAGAGLTLHSSHVAIYESFSNQAAHYLQSLDRIHRRGQKHDVEYLILLCDGTIEIQEYNRLISKENAAQLLLGDTTSTPTTRESFLKSLKEASVLLEQVDPSSLFKRSV